MVSKKQIETFLKTYKALLISLVVFIVLRVRFKQLYEKDLVG